MSQKIYGKAEPRIIGADQTPNGLGRIIVSFPMVFEKIGGINFPVPQSYPEIANYGFAGARGKEDASGTWSWEITYQGLGLLGNGSNSGTSGTTPADQIEYAFEPADIDVPITSHPQILEFMKTYGGRDDGTGRVVFPAKLPITDPKEKQLFNADVVTTNKANPFFGYESFESHGGIWTKTYTTNGFIPASAYTGIESIVQSVPTPEWMTMPSFGTDRNWLKLISAMRIRGRALTITERYKLSGRGGINPAVYTGNNG